MIFFFNFTGKIIGYIFFKFSISRENNSLFTFFQQSSSSQDIYEDFQTTNQHMQQEILSLKTYIGQQQMVNATLQQQLQGVGGI